MHELTPVKSRVCLRCRRVHARSMATRRLGVRRAYHWRGGVVCAAGKAVCSKTKLVKAERFSIHALHHQPGLADPTGALSDNQALGLVPKRRFA